MHLRAAEARGAFTLTIRRARRGAMHMTEHMPLIIMLTWRTKPT